MADSPESIRNGNPFTAFAKRSNWYHFLLGDGRETLRVFFAVLPQSLLLDYRILGPACTFPLLRAALKCFVVPWRPEGWEGMSTPRSVGFLR